MAQCVQQDKETHFKNRLLIILRELQNCLSLVWHSGQNKGERGGTAFPHLLFLVYTVPPPEFEGYALAS